MTQTPHILVDADACPVKEEIYKVAYRHEVPVTIVSNSFLRVPDHPLMGDNRDHSNDSRYWGFVPEENIVGRAFAVWMHWDGGLPSFTSVQRIE